MDTRLISLMIAAGCSGQAATPTPVPKEVAPPPAATPAPKEVVRPPVATPAPKVAPLPAATPAPKEVALPPVATPAPKEVAQPSPTKPVAMPPMALVPPVVPAELAVPEGHKLVMMARGTGVQIYECAPGATGALAWTLHAPRADLIDAAGAVIGSHYGGVDKHLAPGPYWTAADGSRVHGTKPVSVPHEGALPLLRIAAADVSGTGIFGKVAFVQRLDTTGGIAPAGTCTAGKLTEVPFTAKYYFYAQ